MSGGNRELPATKRFESLSLHQRLVLRGPRPPRLSQAMAGASVERRQCGLAPGTTRPAISVRSYLIASIEQPQVIAKILAHVASTSPEQYQSELPLGARAPPQQSSAAGAMVVGSFEQSLFCGNEGVIVPEGGKAGGVAVIGGGNLTSQDAMKMICRIWIDDPEPDKSQVVVGEHGPREFCGDVSGTGADMTQKTLHPGSGASRS